MAMIHHNRFKMKVTFAKKTRSMLRIKIVKITLPGHCPEYGGCLAKTNPNRVITTSSTVYINQALRIAQDFSVTNLSLWMNQCDAHPKSTSPKRMPALAGVFLYLELSAM